MIGRLLDRLVFSWFWLPRCSLERDRIRRRGFAPRFGVVARTQTAYKWVKPGSHGYLEESDELARAGSEAWHLSTIDGSWVPMVVGFEPGGDQAIMRA